MASYIGEIRMFGGNFPPNGWAFCQGQLIPISENDALFTLIGTTYGGDGQSTFALPNLSSRVPVHMDGNFPIGSAGGTETVTLTTNQIPTHIHLPACNSQPGTSTAPGNGVWAANPDVGPYAAAIASAGNMDPNTMTPTGGSQPHDNMLPYLAINFIISLFGVFPTQN
jgi:microcystin-dependent protein